MWLCSKPSPLHESDCFFKIGELAIDLQTESIAFFIAIVIHKNTKQIVMKCLKLLYREEHFFFYLLQWLSALAFKDRTEAAEPIKSSVIIIEIYFSYFIY